MVGAELADLLGVSRRTVRYDIGRINRLRGSALVNSDRAGYSLNLDAYRGVLRDAPWAASVLDDDERLLVHLLDHEERGLYDAATECYLGESAVRSAVTRLAPRLETQGLRLQLNASRIQLEGPELDRRRVLGSLVRDAANTAKGGDQRLSRLLPKVDLARVEAVVDDVLAEAPTPIDDVSRHNLVVNVAISLQRSGKSVPQAPEDAQDDGVGPLADAVMAGLGRAFPSQIGDRANRAYLRHLVLVSLNNAAADPAATKTGPDQSAIRDVVAHAVDECIVHFDLHVQRDKLVTDITQHTQRLIARSATLVYFRNGLRESLRTRSPYLYDVAVYLAHQISSSLGVRVSDDEISLFAIYLGLYADHHDGSSDAVSVTLVCPRYQTLREWLLARLAEQLGARLTMVGIVTTLAEAEATDCELIVTTIGGYSATHPVVEISALCSELDVAAIRAAVTRIGEERERGRTAAVLARVLDPRLFFIDDQFADATTTIDFLCERLIDTGRVPDSYAASVRVREEYSSTAFAHRFAVPHSMDFVAHQTTIAILVPKGPIRWGESDVVMVLMLAVNQDDYAEFSQFYQRLVHLLCDTELFTELRHKRDFDSFRGYLAERLASQDERDE